MTDNRATRSKSLKQYFRCDGGRFRLTFEEDGKRGKLPGHINSSKLSLNFQGWTNYPTYAISNRNLFLVDVFFYGLRLFMILGVILTKRNGCSEQSHYSSNTLENKYIFRLLSLFWINHGFWSWSMAQYRMEDHWFPGNADWWLKEVYTNFFGDIKTLTTTLARFGCERHTDIYPSPCWDRMGLLWVQ